MKKNPRISSKALRVFLLGSGISKSISPAMHNRAFEKIGFNAEYSLLDVSGNEFASEMIKIQSANDILGFNITVPYKERILPYVYRVDKQSKSVEAINTVKVSKGRMFGYNTDVDGVRITLSKLGIDESAKRCVILGAGGAAKACAYAVLRYGFGSLTLLNRSLERASKMATHLSELFPKAAIEGLPLEKVQFSRVIVDCDLLINAITSSSYLGIDLDFTLAYRKMKFFDLDYTGSSPLLKRATSNGIKSINGLSMLVEQAAKSFEIWTGVAAPRRIMTLAARKELS